MQTTPLNSGELMLDAAGFVSLQAVLNACRMPQCRGFSFYTGARYGVARDQINAAIDHGKLVSPNWERRGNEAMYGAGAWAVDSARAGVEAWGIDPSQVPTVLSGVDFSTTTADFAQLDYWHETACDQADATNTWIGYYGETRYGNHLIQQPWWNRADRPTWTWGGSGVINGTNAKQQYGFPSGVNWDQVGVTVDESEGRAGLLMVSSFDSPPPPLEVSVSTVVIQCEDADAAFEGELSAQGIVTFVRWIDGPRMATLLGAPFNCQRLVRPVSTLSGMTLVGMLPPGDSHHTWTGREFYYWTPPGQGPKGDPGPPGPAPHGTFQASVIL